MAARQRQVMHIARLKRSPDAIRDPERIAVILDHIRTAARHHGLDEAVAVPVWRELLERSARAQQTQLRREAETRLRLDHEQDSAGSPSRSPRDPSPMHSGSAVRNPS
ncbi:chorismate mutase [Brevundimonas sp.]|uniref:chorismate mutase n=1 Tax=Brevundimonas sp. TaxID=1871086 RepID=UPI003A8D6AC9